MNEKIVLIDNELIIREKITLYDLRLLHPEILLAETPLMYRINEDYVINGIEYINPISFISKSEINSEYWTKAGVGGISHLTYSPSIKNVPPELFFIDNLTKKSHIIIEAILMCCHPKTNSFIINMLTHMMESNSVGHMIEVGTMMSSVGFSQSQNLEHYNGGYY